MFDFESDITDYLDRTADTIRNLDRGEINSFANVLVQAWEKESAIYIFGNGGSASTASHFAVDFNKGLNAGLRKKFRVFCLNDNVPTIMAIANDISFDEVFQHQLVNLLQPGDVVVGISGSGNSRNVVNALSFAREMGAIPLSLVGYDGGKAKHIASHSIHVKINDMQVVEDAHLVIDHLLFTILRARLRGV